METKTPAHILTVEEILAAPDIVEQVVEVPEWGGSLRIRSFTKAQVQFMSERASKQTLDRRTGQATRVVDADRLNDIMFAEGVIEPRFSPEQVAALASKNAAPYLRVMKAILQLSGLSDTSTGAAEATFSE